MAIKIQLGKYRLNMPYSEFVSSAIALYNLIVLPIEPRHTAVIAELPSHHRDPFDRLIIAQAIVEQLTIVSADKAFDAYAITRLW